MIILTVAAENLESSDQSANPILLALRELIKIVLCSTQLWQPKFSFLLNKF